ncbi:MAG: hypothetical protein SGCHY_005556 [Lobulomycetales sp.]
MGEWNGGSKPRPKPRSLRPQFSPQTEDDDSWIRRLFSAGGQKQPVNSPSTTSTNNTTLKQQSTTASSISSDSSLMRPPSPECQSNFDARSTATFASANTSVRAMHTPSVFLSSTAASVISGKSSAPPMPETASSMFVPSSANDFSSIAESRASLFHFPITGPACGSAASVKSRTSLMMSGASVLSSGNNADRCSLVVKDSVAGDARSCSPPPPTASHPQFVEISY